MVFPSGAVFPAFPLFLVALQGTCMGSREVVCISVILYASDLGDIRFVPRGVWESRIEAVSS